MQMNYEWIKDPKVFRINRLDAHASIKSFKTTDEMRRGNSSYYVSLNGIWKFHYSEGFNTLVNGFEAVDYNCSNWDDIKVPAHIQMEGYGSPMYINQIYPWSGTADIRPGEIPEKNPTGSYVTWFDKTELMENNEVRITFHGVESAFALWINGTFVGYSEDSFTPSSFDITSLLKEGRNKVAVQVFRFSSGSWLEDQDFFRFSGIFRPVELEIIPSVHVEDLKVRTDLSNNYTHASVKINATVKTEADNYSVHFKLKDGEEVVAETVINNTADPSFVIEMDNPKLWSAEVPNLYQLYVEVEKDGTLIETFKQNVGVREFKIINGIMCINGKRVVFHGVNRHEFTAETGRVVSYEQTVKDLKIMKDNNINAIRTSHYPNQTFLYDLCDELGLYAIDEVNLETHGTWSEDFDPDLYLPNNKMEWLDIILDRANSMVERDKNHPSIIIWSLGNESRGGLVIYEESKFIKSKDDTRVIHYEGLSHDRTYNDSSDIESQMYTPAAEVAQFIEEHPEKPFVLCEFAHAMGNSNGALYKYTDLEKKYPLYQGGFIWDFVDQAIYANGKFNYGGDLRDRPSDYDFCGNGIVFADRSYTPKMQEVRYCYQYADINITPDTITITNDYLFRNLNEFDFEITLYREGYKAESKKFTVEAAPSETFTMDNPFKPCGCCETSVVVTMCQYGHEYAHEQYIYEVKKECTHAEKGIQIIEDYLNIGVVGEHFNAIFSKQKGLVSYKYAGHEMIRVAPRPNFFRAATNNDVENQYGYRHGQWLQASLYSLCKYVKTERSDTVAKIFYEYVLPFHLGENKVSLIYTVYGDGEIVIDLDYTPEKDNIQMPAFGMMFNLYDEMNKVSYYGFGEEENYIDRQCGALLGRYSYDVRNNMTPYLYPQECGNRINVRDMNISDGHVSLEFTGNGFEFTALPYTPFEIENAKHHDELPAKYQTVVCINEQQMGIAGDNTWGARTHDEFLLTNEKNHHLTVTMIGKK